MNKAICHTEIREIREGGERERGREGEKEKD